MKDKKSLISKCLLGGGLLALICGIFCFFGTAVIGSFKMVVMEETIGETASFSNLFSFMFGTEATMTVSSGGVSSDPISATMNRVSGTTALFAIEVVIIVLAVILLVGIFAKKLQKKHITIGCCIVCVLALVAVILAFCSKKMIADSLGGEIEIVGAQLSYSLGSAGISYGVLGIVGILATGAGLFLGKDEAVAA